MYAFVTLYTTDLSETCIRILRETSEKSVVLFSGLKSWMTSLTACGFGQLRDKSEKYQISYLLKMLFRGWILYKNAVIPTTKQGNKNKDPTYIHIVYAPSCHVGMRCERLFM